MSKLGHICHEGSDIWMAQVPVVCFDIIEYHRPERVVRQFGYAQFPSGPSSYSQDLHDTNRRGKHTTNWAEWFAQYVGQWNKRATSIVEPLHHINHSQVHVEYMGWYRKRTRLFISRQSRAPPSRYQPAASDIYTMVNTSTNKVSQ